MAEFLRMHDQRSRETQEYLIGNYNKYKETQSCVQSSLKHYNRF